MSMKIRFPGALTTIQDAGRFGFQHMGVSPSGAMDILSMEQANALAGNPQGEAVLEFTLAGPMLTFTRDTIVGLSGADMDMKLNGTPVSPGTSFPVHAGDELISGFVRRGCRAYLSVQGGFDVPVIMGSRSTNLKCGLGGFHGRALQAGDELPFRKEADISSFTPRALGFPCRRENWSFMLFLVLRMIILLKKETRLFIKKLIRLPRILTVWGTGWLVLW